MSIESLSVPGFPRQVAEIKTRSRKGKSGTQLTGRGGVGLVIFHLARLRFEFSETPFNSDAGDLWVQCRDGTIIAVEVKTTTTGSWHIRRGQLFCASIFAFVHLRTARVAIMTAREVQELLREVKQPLSRDHFSISEFDLPSSSNQAWHLFGAANDASLSISETFCARRPHRSCTKRVKKRLASGEIKEYVYPPAK